MGAKTIAITVPEELHEKMQRWKEYYNYSRVASDAISDKMKIIESLYEKVNDKRTLEEILKSVNWKAKLAKPDSIYEFRELGETLGVYYAKNGPYQKVKELEEEMRKVEIYDEEEVRALVEKKICIELILIDWGVYKAWRLVSSHFADMVSDAVELATLGFPDQARRVNLLSIKEGFIHGIIQYAGFIWRKKP